MEGKARGSLLISDKDFVLEKRGEEGLKLIESRAKELGMDVPYRTAVATEWYPAGLAITSVLLINDTLGLSYEERKEWGEFAAKMSLIIKLIMKFFLSLPKFAEQIPYYWKMHFTAGSLEVTELDEEGKKMILTVRDVELPKVYLDCMENYFGQMIEFVVGKDNLTESKIVSRDNCYEYVARWR